MNQTRMEIVVGTFVLVGVLCLGYLAIRLGKLEVLGGSGYVLYADFASVAGLKTGDPVEVAGVEVGKVKTITLADGRARLGIRIEADVELQEDVVASVRARGLIGDKFILITMGASEKLLVNGDKIRETESPPDITELLGKYIGGDLTSLSK